jgi:hypothetical protein
MATSRCVNPQGAFCREPTRSNPHTAKGLGWHVRLPCVELASSVGSHNPSSVGDSGWPVEPLPGGVTSWVLEPLPCSPTS